MEGITFVASETMERRRLDSGLDTRSLPVSGDLVSESHRFSSEHMINSAESGLLIIFILILIIATIGFFASMSAAVNHKRDEKRSQKREKTQNEIAYLRGRLDKLTRKESKEKEEDTF